MFTSKMNGACDLSLNAMEVGDITNMPGPVQSHPSLCVKAEQTDQQVPVIEGLFSSVLKEAHIQPCVPETSTIDAIVLNEKQVSMQAATAEDLEIYFSEECLKSYVVFDQCAGQRTLLCHPTLLNDPPLSVPSFTRTTNDVFTRLQDFSDKAVENILNICPLTEQSAWGARLLAYRDSMEAAFTALDRVKVNGFDCSEFKTKRPSFMTCLNPVGANQINCKGKCVSDDTGEGIETSWHEDTDDINALLSSDEELSSTCNTLGNLDVYNSLVPADDGDDQSGNNPRKKRKILKPETEDADVDSTRSDADSSLKMMTSIESKHLQASHFESPTKSSHASKVGLSKLDSVLCGEKLLRRCTLPDRVHTYELHTEFHSDTMVVKNAKLLKIKEAFEELKSVIPGIDCLDDTATVLENAVHYIQSLQGKWQKFGGQK